jgi:hypothetical protein
VAAGELKLGTKTTNDDCSKHQGLKDWSWNVISGSAKQLL